MAEYIDDFDDEEEDSTEREFEYKGKTKSCYHYSDDAFIRKQFDQFVVEKIKLDRLELRKRNGELTRRDRIAVMILFLEWLSDQQEPIAVKHTAREQRIMGVMEDRSLDRDGAIAFMKEEKRLRNVASVKRNYYANKEKFLAYQREYQAKKRFKKSD